VRFPSQQINWGWEGVPLHYLSSAGDLDRRIGGQLWAKTQDPIEKKNQKKSWGMAQAVSLASVRP
jgi:hypothetical protein